MTTYTTIADATIDQDSPVTEALMTALRDNLIASLEGATDAPVNAYEWHPYDMVNVGDGADGLFYDYSVDGSSTSIETPTFADGYEYAMLISGLSPSGGTSAFTIDLYGATSAAWKTGFTTSNVSAAITVSGFVEIHTPRLTGYGWRVSWKTPLGGSDGSTYGEGIDSAASTTSEKISKARIAHASGTDAGTVALWRRRTLIA